MNNDLRQDDKLDVEELKRWMKPRLQPYCWKKYLWRKRYDYEKEHYDEISEGLFGEKIDVFYVNSTQNGISKDDFFKGVTKELRKGNKKVKYV